MNWKEFLKPDWRKIVIFVITLIIFAWIMEIPLRISYRIGGMKDGTSYLNPYNLIANFIVWYLISCLIVWIYNKVKKK